MSRTALRGRCPPKSWPAYCVKLVFWPAYGVSLTASPQSAGIEKETDRVGQLMAFLAAL
jgi:hypothetical protein